MATDQVKLELPHETIKEKLNVVIKKKGLVNYEVEIFPGSKKGDNYGGIVYKIAVNGINEADGKKANLNFFCKIPVSVASFQEEVGMDEVFLREIKFYEEIIIDMKKLEAGKDIQDGFNAYAECVATGSSRHEEFLIMEDITKRNFSMFDRMKKLDFNHTKLVMQTMGKYHAYSFAMRDQKPELLKQYSEELNELFLSSEMKPPMETFLNNLLKGSVENLKFEGIYQEKWEAFHPNYFKILKDCVKGELAEPYAVICHGDCWNNNMMFKYENGVPTEICLFDWQICRYASPVLDLVYYIFCCTEKSFRDEHYHSILQIYYESFSCFLKQLGSDPEMLFPYSEFQNQLKKFGKFGFGMAIMAIPIIVTSSEDVVGMDEMIGDASPAVNNEKTLKIWTTRLCDCFKDMVDLGYF